MLYFQYIRILNILSLKSKRSLIFYFCIISGAMIAIGRFYDPRISFLGINFSLILSFVYIITIYYLTKLVNQIKINTVNILQIVFYFVAIISTLLLWLIYGVNQDGLDKLTIFTLITFPISILISQIFRADDAHNLLRILFGFSCILLLYEVKYHRRYHLLRPLTLLC